MGASAAGGLLVARGLGVSGIGSPAGGLSVPALLATLGASLTPRQRTLVVFPEDHPARQITNSQSVLERPHVATLFSPAQQRLTWQLYDAMLSADGRKALAGTVAVEGRLGGAVLSIFGEPESGRAHAVLSSGHWMLRGGGDGHSAFEGGLAYGHQIGNERWRVEGNSFQFHGDAANRVYASLSSPERAQAIVPAPPHELTLQVQDARGSFPGVSVAALGEASQREVSALLETVLSTWPVTERDKAHAAIAANGGLGALHFAVFANRGFYEDMRAWNALDENERGRRGDPYWQVWRLEGPGTIVHFKGHPHVHAYVRIVSDPARANIGEALAATRTLLEGEPVRRLLEQAMRRDTGEALAFYNDEVPGRFCPGVITTGLAYSLDPYRNQVVVATIEGHAVAAPLRERLAARGSTIDPAARHRVATTDYLASRRDLVGEPGRVETGSAMLRDAVVAELRASGLSALT